MESEKIVKAKRIGWVNWTLLTLFLIGIPSFVHADISDILLKFHPYITAEEEYSTNIFLSPNSTKLDDWITRVIPGLRFSTLQAGRYGIDLDVAGGYTYYAKNQDFSYWSPSARLDAWYAITPRLTFRVRDYFIRSDAAREDQYENEITGTAATQPDQFVLSSQRGVHAIYYRNVVEPSAEYRFGRENLASVLYRNNIYQNKNPLYEDSMENTINPLFTYWFDMRNGITLEGRITDGSFEVSDDLTSYEARGRYTHRIDPKLSLFGEYTFIRENFERDTVDYDVHDARVGMQYRFTPTLTGTIEGGYYWQLEDTDQTTSGPALRVSLIQLGERTSYAFIGETGYYEDYFTSENRGFARYARVYGTINHRLTQKMSVRLTGSVERPKYDDGQKDWIWAGRVGAYYLLFRWLTVGLEGGYRTDHSNVEGEGYTEYSGIFRITATFN